MNPTRSEGIRTTLVLSPDCYKALLNEVTDRKVKGISNASMSSVVQDAIRNYFAAHIPASKR